MSLEISLRLPGWVAEELGEPSRRFRSDEEKMELAVRLADRNVAEGTGGPFGACVFEMETGRLVAPGVNLVVPAGCSVAHAEVMAIVLAQKARGSFDLAAAEHEPMELFASAQPCIQCYGAIWWSGLRRLVIGARGADVEAATGFEEGLLPERWQEHLERRTSLPPVEVRTDCIRDRALEPLQRYSESGGLIYNPGSTAPE